MTQLETQFKDDFAKGECCSASLCLPWHLIFFPPLFSERREYDRVIKALQKQLETKTKEAEDLAEEKRKSDDEVSRQVRHSFRLIDCCASFFLFFFLFSCCV